MLQQVANPAEAAAALETAKKDWEETSKFVDTQYTPAAGLAEDIPKAALTRSLRRRAHLERDLSFRDEFRGHEQASVARWQTYCYLIQVRREVSSLN